LAKFLSLPEKIISGFHNVKNFLIKKSTSRGKNLCLILLNFLIIFLARIPELKVVVVIRNNKFLELVFRFSITGIILFNSPMLEA
jgi:hypothetical protein